MTVLWWLGAVVLSFLVGAAAATLFNDLCWHRRLPGFVNPRDPLSGWVVRVLFKRYVVASCEATFEVGPPAVVGVEAEAKWLEDMKKVCIQTMGKRLGVLLSQHLVDTGSFTITEREDGVRDLRGRVRLLQEI